VALRQGQLVRWLEVDSTSGREGAFLEVLERDLRAEGFEVARLPVPGVADRWNLTARWGDATPKLWFCTHVDTVPPFLPVRVEEGRVYGRGACDTKGVLLAMVEALVRLRAADAALAARAGLLMVIGEETDHGGAAAIRDMGLAASRFVLGEPTQNAVAVGQRGILKARLTARGVAGHSAFPEQGASAIDALLEALARVRAVAWPVDEALGATSVNIGLIEGGVAANVFAPSAQAVLMVRVVSSCAQVEALLRGCLGPDCALEVLSQAEPQRFAADHGEASCVLAFNSDAAWLRPLAPVWLGGPGDIRCAHATHEHIVWAEWAEGVALYERLARRALAQE
jgi:acetylornithine deacetylase